MSWAEFGETWLLPVDPETDYIYGIPWEAAKFDISYPRIDIDSVSGLTTIILTERFPETEILAIEADSLIRSLRMLRIAERDAIRIRTIVLPNSIIEAWLSHQCGELLFNVNPFLAGRAVHAISSGSGWLRSCCRVCRF